MAWNDELQFNLDVNQDLLNTQLFTQNILDANQKKLNAGLMFKNNLGNLAGIASGIMSGPVGWAGLAVKVLGDNINAARSQFDYDSYADTMNDAARSFMQSAGYANTTSDLLSLPGKRINYLDDINNQGYKWDGNILNGIGAIIGNARTEREKQKARDLQASIDNQYTLGLANAQDRVRNKTYRFGMANYLNNAAMGGPLSTHGADFTDDLIRIDAGGSHESNPFGGVLSGIDPNGIPNLVEEGETIWDKGDEEYVFSKRLKAPKSLVKKFALGGGKKGLTYSEAARKASSKSGAELRPNDPISKRTKDAILAELEDSQEEKRAALKQREAIKALSEMSPEEFQATMMSSPMSQQEIEQPQMPPQGVEEEPMMQEPVQGGGMYEPVGVQGFALGGNIFDGKQESSRKITKELAGPYRLPGIGVIAQRDLYDKEVEMHQDDKGQWWVEGRMVGKGSAGEAAAQRYARLIANTRASQNMSGDLGSASYVQAEREGTPTIKGKAEVTSNGIERPYNIFSTPYLNADFSDNLKEQTTPDNKYDVRRVGRFLPDDYGSYFGRIHAPGFEGTPGWSVLAPGVPLSEAVQETPPTPQVREDAAVKQNTRGITPIAAIQQGNSGRTPNKIFSISGVNPIDQWRQRSIIYNPPAPRSAVQKAVEGAAETDPENTVSVGAQQNRMLPTWMRYAPIVGGGLSVLSDIFSRPDYSGYESLIADARRVSSPVSIPVETIGDRIRRNPFDERLMINQANQNLAAGLRSTRDNAGGNRAYRQFANNLMAYNNQNQLSDIARTAYLANRQDTLQSADFNRGTPMFNAQAINQRNLTEGQLNANRGYQGYYARANALNALENARRYDDQMASADLTAFLTSLGNLGRENFDLSRLEALRREGRYNIGYNGRTGDLFFSPTETYTVAKGGKVKTKKRRF